ncbi:hypothetical protein GCM10009429_01810 [Dyella marensis]
MNKIEVEIFTDQGNNAVLRLPSRKFPGLLLQGDSLRNLAESAERVVELCEGGGDELKEEAAELADSLRGLLRWYESIAGM